jgi:glutamate synthase (NADPH/NADH) small chain
MKRFVNQRLALMEQEGVVFRPGLSTSAATLTRGAAAPSSMRSSCAGGAGWARELQVPGRELAGIHFAVDYLTPQNRICEGDEVPADR